MRKPRPFKVGGYTIAECVEYYGGSGDISFTSAVLSEESAERFAAWLLKAAEWIREKEG